MNTELMYQCEKAKNKECLNAEDCTIGIPHVHATDGEVAIKCCDFDGTNRKFKCVRISS